mmetsp:Transcript_45563/g.85073  ORF Transcript_45563/g.85073 Transcript_45563/m.85073 type:complete len:414 (+) Transcript_45563:113-1354(+)
MANRKGRFAVIDCEDASKWEGHHHIWIAALACERETWDHYRAWAGELPAIKGEGKPFTGLVITGSHHDAHNDQVEWINRLCDFLKDVVENHPNVKVFGGCFGSQVLARALGGRVERNPGGSFVIGAEELLLTQALHQRSDFVYAVANSRATGGKGLGGSVRIVSSHADQVLDLPPGAELLASSKSTKAEIWSHGSNVLAVQGHPEMTPALCRERIMTTLVGHKKITPEEEEAAWRTMEAPLAAALVLDMVKYFLRGKPPRGKTPVDAIAAVETTFGVGALLGHAASAGAATPIGQNTGHVPQLPELMDDMFTNVTAAITGELNATANEYELLKDMNHIASDKYKEMGDFAEGMLVFVERMRAKEDLFQPYIQQIEEIDHQVGELESVVSKLDLYTRRMEAQFRVLTHAASSRE